MEEKQLHIHYCLLLQNENIYTFYRAAIVPHEIVNRGSKISVCTQAGGLTRSKHQGDKQQSDLPQKLLHTHLYIIWMSVFGVPVFFCKDTASARVCGSA